MSVEVERQKSIDYTPLERMRHSAAHVMAEAIQEIFPDARFAIGPAIEDGFYYNFDLPRPLTPDDLPDIEQRMQRIITARHPFQREHVWDSARLTGDPQRSGSPGGQYFSVKHGMAMMCRTGSTGR